MCGTCGCSNPAGVRLTVPASGTGHAHGNGDAPGSGHAGGGGPASQTVVLEQRVLAHNDRLAEGNRDWFNGRGILAVNLMSSPGSGKTTLLERTIRDLGGELDLSVVEGDQETEFDAERIRATGCRVVQVNTGAGCHLDAGMLAGALRVLEPADRSILFIENVGNLVCPALFDLGESCRVIIMSVTEGADKPLKYPHMFRTADLVLLNKVDLLPYVNFDVDRFRGFLSRVRPAVQVVEVSATRGNGIGDWYAWLRARLPG
jgi:hydrogenase nickel incorporation protein HypB